MNANDLVKLIVGVAVGALMLSAILVPVTSDSTTATYEKINEGTPYAEYDGESHTIIVSLESNTLGITTDGEPCEIPVGYNSSATIVYGNAGYVRLAVGSTGYGNVRVYVSETGNSLTPTAGSPVTITIESDSVTIAKNTTTYTASFVPLAYIASSGDYVLTTSPYVTEDSVIYIGGTTTYSNNRYISFVGYGDTNDLTATTAFSAPSSDSTVTIEGVTTSVNTSPVIADIIQIDTVVFTANLSDESTLNGTFSYFLAPKTVQCANPNYAGDDIASILGVIPILVTVGLILGVVGVAFSRRE